MKTYFINLNLNKIKTFKVLTAVILAGFFINWSKLPISILFLMLTIFLVSIYLPSKFPLQRIALASVFVIGLSPFYLLVRGFLTESKLTKIDLYLFGILIIYFFKIFSRSKTSMKESARNRIKELNHSYLGLASVLFGLGLEIFLLSRGLGHGVAWISSGDSKNHLIAATSLVDYGDLLPSTFLTQPINLPSTLSLMLAQLGADLSVNLEKLAPQIEVYAFFWALLIGILGIAFTGLLEVIRGRSEKRISNFTFFALSLLPFTSFILGPALNDGFFTALFGITTLTVMTSWFIETNNRDSKDWRFLKLGFFVFFATLMSWMFITAVTLPLLILGVRGYLREFSSKHLKIDLSIFMLAIAGAYIIFITDFGQAFQYRIKVVLTANGAVNTSNPTFYYFLISVIAIIGLSQLFNKALANSFFVISSIHAMALLAFKTFSNLDIFSWNYYLLKYQWIMAGSLFGLLAAVLILKLDELFQSKNRKRIFGLTLFLVATFSLSEAVLNSSVNKVLPKIIRGWENPRSSTMELALNQELEVLNPTMFFHYGYAGDARLANFWMNAILSPQDPVRGWNYTIDTAGDPKQLCDVNAYYPKVYVVTSDMKLEDELLKICPKEEFIIKLEPSPI